MWAAALLCLVAGSAATPPGVLAARGAAEVVPRAALYSIRISGQTSYGSFVRNGALLVTPRIRAAGGVNFANGPNAREVGLFSGRPPSSPEQGAIWFATNTAIFQRVGIGNVNQGLAALDVAYVTAGPSSLRVRIDGDFYGLPAARTALLNCMNASSGVLANVYQLIGGTMVVAFRGRRGSRVSGAVSFVGNGYIEPGSSPYRATFVGRRIR
jgi:hypothetical protein